MDVLKAMRSFVAVVDHDGFAAAGRALGRSKSMVMCGHSSNALPGH